MKTEFVILEEIENYYKMRLGDIHFWIETEKSWGFLHKNKDLCNHHIAQRHRKEYAEKIKGFRNKIKTVQEMKGIIYGCSCDKKN